VHTMSMYAKVRRLRLREWLSICEIARRTNLSRNTIKTWLREPAHRTQMAYQRPSRLKVLDGFTAWLDHAVKTDENRLHKEAGCPVGCSSSFRNRASRATTAGWRRVKLTGRHLLEATPGATFMLNPNHRRFTLYPEEIQAILAYGTVARFSTEQLRQDLQIAVSAATASPAELESIARRVLATFPGVHRAYLCESR